MRTAPVGWQQVVRERLAVGALSPIKALEEQNLTAAQYLARPPEWAQAWDLLQAIADYEDRFGVASLWNLADFEICTMAKKLAAEADELDALAIGQGCSLADRLDSIRMLVRCVGIVEDKPIQGEPAIKRAQDPAWWRRRLRVHVARVVEAGAVGLGLVHKGTGGYVSRDGLQRRQAQLKRNAEALAHSLYRNEAGQVFALAELAALGPANPMVRGGELMTRIRGAEEYADARAHVGLFITLTLPSRFHPVKMGSGGRTFPNKKFCGATPRDGQLWLRGMWQKVRSKLQRMGVRVYGLRVAEPHHDATPHWHALLWCEDEAEAQALEAVIRHYWLSDDGDERGAKENRVNFKRMTKGGAAGYVAKYIAKSVGHIALAEHQDLVDGQQLALDFPADARDVKEPGAGHRRVDAWAATWGIRQFQTIGMPSVTVWRELRRVTGDQLDLFKSEGCRETVRAFHACHRHGDVRADWRGFMEAMGGHACKRHQWLLRTAHRHTEPGQVNRYGDEVKVGRIVGLVPQRGRMRGQWLVSRRIAWRAVIQEHAQDGAETGAQAQALGAARAALAAPWTGFNNCTARITHALPRLVFGRGDHEKEDWCTPAAVAHFRSLTAMQREAAWQ
ncbi:replication endonuclease [Acidovorax sp. GBBC 3334]|uniref:replication endonuclease n=1 Tax=Acidovorax sp. GBBC 3334 TaxID=2940496 RepID=UPI002303E169|nr:replication endonuclease [Acidovorax sp. GBBC 3334]MDA8455285.1 replication endonuclease [Acidovorax sp. GBBC 3334]